MDCQRLREVLDYDSETGIFRWRPGTTRRSLIGLIAGCINNQGYRYISVDGKRYRAHRLAWFYVNGRWPEAQLDHLNRRRDDNRIANLRPATQQQNNGNYGLSRHNTSGFKGVHYFRKCGKWQAVITVANKSVHLGLFPTAEGAHAAYLRKAAEIFGEFANGGHTSDDDRLGP
jgi:hypothetical protein